MPVSSPRRGSIRPRADFTPAVLAVQNEAGQTAVISTAFCRLHIVRVAGLAVPVVSSHDLNELDLAADAVHLVATEVTN